MLFYIIQLLLINPLMDSNLVQMEVPLKDMLIALEAAIKILCICKIIISVYFENVIEFLSETGDDRDLVNQIKAYLKDNIRPVLNNNINKSIHYILRTIHFEDLLYPMYVFLLAITSKNFQLHCDSSNEMTEYLKQNILSILQIFQLAYKSKHVYKKLDITHTFQKLKMVLRNFTVSKQFLSKIKSIVDIN
ncbi:hypothetical protein K502DRAFT_354086 [Neoconidiobolus thromboides FSU 785]|nr:hypothetical protein K502DRAFT_354086 [Neoconidiobolus thromboides FSU 785]